MLVTSVLGVSRRFGGRMLECSRIHGSFMDFHLEDATRKSKANLRAQLATTLMMRSDYYYLGVYKWSSLSI